MSLQVDASRLVTESINDLCDGHCVTCCLIELAFEVPRDFIIGSDSVRRSINRLRTMTIN